MLTNTLCIVLFSVRTHGNGQKFDIVRARAHDVSAAQIAVLHARARDGAQLDPRPSHGLSVK